MNIYDNVAEMIASNQKALLFRAKSTGNSTGNLEEIIREGQTVADTQRYATLSSCPALVLNDEVLVLKLGASCIILGRIDK